MHSAGGTPSPLEYHRSSRHDFGRFASSLGYLDWANQPDPFRRFAGATVVALPRVAHRASPPYAELFGASRPPEPLSFETLGEFLRCSLGLSAWKSYDRSRWALRVNPSSGNLHPTEGYIAWQDTVYHYAPEAHALEARAVLRHADGKAALDWNQQFLVGLTSVHWREAWKYGERAFRYCQHDIGHALGALRMAAALLGWQLRIATPWSHRDVAVLLGLDRPGDFDAAEMEEPGILAYVSAAERWIPGPEPERLVSMARAGRWSGRANQLSRSHVDWPSIDAVARASEYPGRVDEDAPAVPLHASEAVSEGSAREIILGRRSATAFSSRGVLRRDTFLRMLARLVPPGVPWDARPWRMPVHLVCFVHRVQDLAPGIYAFMRGDGDAIAAWRQAMHPEFLWERVDTAGDTTAGTGLYLLVPIDARHTARRLACDQDIASDGFFSLAMVADMDAVAARGGWFYRALFWECGLIGQMLYLEAEAAGGRGTGIGCFYDDPVREVLGLTSERWQCLYQFAVGLPHDDGRLLSEPGYAWEG